MQRVSVDLGDALSGLEGIELEPLVLRSSWRWVHVRSVGFLLSAFFRIRKKALRGELDVVLFSSMVSASLAPLLRSTLHSLRIPMAAIAHGLDVTLPGIYQLVLVRRILAALDCVMPVSRATGTECIKRGMPKERVQVIPNGVDTRRKVGTDGRPILRTIDETSLLLCSVGRLVKRKGFAWFIDQVMPLLPGGVHYWIAGSGPQHAAIAAAAKKRRLAHRVRMLGTLADDDIYRLYSCADLLVMPNVPVPGDMEGFGIVMLEAGISATPTVAARLEGIPDVITEGQNGHLVDSLSPRAFVDAILPYYHDRDTLKAASVRAARHTRSTFDWKVVAARYAAHLRALVCEARDNTG